MHGKEKGILFGRVFFLISLGGRAPHVLRAHMGGYRTCGEPDEIELTAIGVELNGPRGVPSLVGLIIPFDRLVERVPQLRVVYQPARQEER